MARPSKYGISNSKITFEKFANAADKCGYEIDAPYHVAYQEFLRYFKRLEQITEHEFIIGAHFVYGWMPTMLTLGRSKSEYIIAVDILNAAKMGYMLKEHEFMLLRSFVNNSLIGTSKLLHFINPDKFTIWDGRVCNFIYGVRVADSAPLTEVKRYLAYLENCANLITDDRFTRIYTLICEKIGYKVTPYRAVEWVMYSQGINNIPPSIT